MIELTKLNNEVIHLNPFVIESVQENNSTVITLTNGKKLVIKDKAEVIKEKIKVWWSGIFNLQS